MEIATKKIVLTSSVVIFLLSVTIPFLIKEFTLFFVFYACSWQIFWHLISPVFADNAPWATLPLAGIFNVFTYVVITRLMAWLLRRLNVAKINFFLISWCILYIVIVFFIPLSNGEI